MEAVGMRPVFPSPDEIMPKMKKILFLLVLPLALAGCSSSITNLTPSRLSRSSDGTYHVEAAWRTTEQAIRLESLKPSVLVGFESYEMRPELVVKDRWEAFVPVPADQKLVHYQFRFDFSRNKIPAPIEDSKLSPSYSLEIVDKSAGDK
jgi:uncharacterized protein YceK